MEGKDLALIIQRFQEKVYSLDFNAPLDYVETEIEREYVSLASRASHYILLEDDGETAHITHAEEKYQRWHRLKAWKYQLGPDLVNIEGKQVLVSTFYDGEQPGLRRAPKDRLEAPVFKTLLYRLGEQVADEVAPSTIYTATCWKDALLNHQVAIRDGHSYKEAELKLYNQHLQAWPSLVQQPGTGLSSELSKWLEALSDKNRAYFLKMLQEWSDKAHQTFHRSLQEGMHLLIAQFIIDNDLGEPEWFSQTSHQQEIHKLSKNLVKLLCVDQQATEEAE